MSGHSHWSGIKHKKEATDKKRGQVFSKLLALITAAAKTEPNPDFNPRLRTAVMKAQEANVPKDNIERALKRGSDTNVAIEEIILEAYGPGGIAILIEGVTDNRNRTIPQVKKVLSDHEGKWAESGSVRWAFDPPAGGSEAVWIPKFPQKISAADEAKLMVLVEALEDHDDVQRVFTNAEWSPDETHKEA
jgi:YebC/PmpR family DNA-binding regulatory protein